MTRRRSRSCCSVCRYRGRCVAAVLTAVLQEASTLEMMNLEFDSFFYPATASIDGVVITQVS